MEPETPGSVLPPTRWNLTAPESLALLNGASTSGAEAFKLGLTELLARGALQLDSVSQGSFFRREVAMLRDGARAATPRERALEGIWNLYQRTPSRS